MKQASPYLSAALLVGYVIYLAFIPASLPHSIIFTSLAGLFAYNLFLLSRTTPQLEEEIAKLKRELVEQMEKQKELHGKKIADLEGEVGKLSLSSIKASSSPSSSKGQARKEYTF